MKKKDLSGKDHLSKFDTKRPAGYPSDKEVPAVLVLKRKAIRVYPDNQKVALYYSQALDKYVSIPFGLGADNLGIHMNEETKPRKRRPETDIEDQPDILNRIKHLSPEVQEIVKKRLGQKIKTKGGYKYPVSELDVIARTPQSDPALRNIKGGYRKKAITDIASLGKGEMSAGETAIKLVGLGARAAANAVRKRVSKPKSPSPIKESFKKKIGVIKEETGLDEGVLDSLLKVGSKVSAAGSSVAGKTKSLANRAKRKLRRNAIQNLAARRGQQDVKTSAGEEPVSALDAAKAAAVLATTPRSQQQFGNIGTQTTNVPVEKPQGELMNLVAFNQQKRMLMPESFDCNLDAIKHIVENNIKYHELSFGDRTVSLNNSVAKKVLNLYESLNKQNKKKIESMLNEDVSSFRKVINFAIRQ